MYLDKLILGTAALGGKAYGGKPRIPKTSARMIMHHAFSAGIRKFDTAPSYGQAEDWLAKTLGPNIAECEITTKTRGNMGQFLTSLRRFRKAKKTIVLWHQRKADEQATLQVDGMSGYASDNQGWWYQADWNLLTQHFGIGEQARSVFLRGVLAGGPCPPKLLPARKAAFAHAAAMGMNLPELALRAALQNSSCDVIVGLTSVAEIDWAVEIAKTERNIGPIRYLSIDPKLTDPRTW